MNERAEQPEWVLRKDINLPPAAVAYASKALAYAARGGGHDCIEALLGSTCHYIAGVHGRPAVAAMLRGLADDVEGGG